jgi:hypothetical protein
MPLVTRVWHAGCLIEGKADEGLNTLRITFQDTAEAIEMRLEGRVAGPWASDVTYADVAGKRALRTIYAQTRATFITNTPWAQFLAEEVTSNKAVNEEEGE